jgi:hypothetical protein
LFPLVFVQHQHHADAHQRRNVQTYEHRPLDKFSDDPLDVSFHQGNHWSDIEDFNGTKLCFAGSFAAGIILAPPKFFSGIFAAPGSS